MLLPLQHSVAAYASLQRGGGGAAAAGAVPYVPYSPSVPMAIPEGAPYDLGAFKGQLFDDPEREGGPLFPSLSDPSTPRHPPPREGASLRVSLGAPLGAPMRRMSPPVAAVLPEEDRAPDSPITFGGTPGSPPRYMESPEKHRDTCRGDKSITQSPREGSGNRMEPEANQMEQGASMGPPSASPRADSRQDSGACQ